DAAVMFVAWTRPRRGTRADVLLTCMATLLASAMAVALGALLQRTPPYLDARTAALYPLYLTGNTSQNCFPSNSTALYAAVCCGAWRNEPLLASLLWAGLPMLVALPRMYVGGHFFTDVLAGLACGVVGYAGARLLGRRAAASAAGWAEASPLRLRVASFIIF